jgi:hypothetical protein
MVAFEVSALCAHIPNQLQDSFRPKLNGFPGEVNLVGMCWDAALLMIRRL